ncbi:MAG TPA: DnaB-like helicase C-terminal domain-containing protein [Candidatus Paceibacterota bacterium]|nr:DnaB-like helicase C-terminal domain-containing protein [Candidatus Paceibacterota bacterium]
MGQTTQPTTGENKEIDNFLSNFKDENLEPFDPEYQNKFLKVFATDKEGFPERIQDIVQVEYFDSYQKILLDYQLKFFSKYREVAKFSTLKDIINEKEKGLAKDHLLGLIEKIEQTSVDNILHIKDSSYRYFKERSVKNCIYQMALDLKKHNYDSMKQKLEDALRAGEIRETGHNYVTDINKRLVGDFRRPISAMPGLDALIGGGLAQGEMGIVLAPTGGGKSMMLVKFACTAFLAGKKVLYYTLELSEEAVGNRIDACLNQIRIKEVWDFPDVIKENTEEIAKNGGSLIIRGFDSGFATINTLMSHVKTLQVNDNFIPDIIFIDYGDLLKPLDSYSEKRHSLDSIYVGIRGMATQLKIPIWNAAQTNRTGMDQEQISLSSIGESLGNARAADIVIGVGRTAEDKENNTATIGILKNRNGGDGFYRPAIFDTSKIHIELTEFKPGDVGVPKSKPKNYQNNTTNKKTENSADEVEDAIDNILLD